LGGKSKAIFFFTKFLLNRPLTNFAGGHFFDKYSLEDNTEDGG